MNMKRLFLCLICILYWGLYPAYALTLSFNQVDSGTHTPIDLANQFSAFGVSFTDVYCYYDTTDNYFGGDSYGIAKWNCKPNWGFPRSNWDSRIFYTHAVYYFCTGGLLMIQLR